MVIKKPGQRSNLNKQGGNRKPQTFKICSCGKEFGPVETLKQKFCSKRCAYDNVEKRVSHKHVRTKEAIRANANLKYHVDKGNILKPSKCEKCGCENIKIEGAHYNYKEPLKVKWLCGSCHVKWDKDEPKGGTKIIARWEKYTGKKAELING